MKQDIAIQAVNLGKRYRIGVQRERYRTLRDTVADAATRPARALRSGIRRSGLRAAERPPGSTDESAIWALNEVSFTIRRGEVVGIIGRNGAGKSTLLKVLSRITEPTLGYADINGRVGSLLEVGTGFHPELTGRENIHLSGAILGMRRSEIERQFDEIVAFAEVEKFVDTPVKRYSSGLYVRLAFGVAAHLQPEILLVDEVLAVGDVAFQRKCLGKMEEVAHQGRTVLFVSHNMSAVKELCQAGILLDAGHVVFQGGSARCIAEYLKRLDTEPFALASRSELLSTGAPVVVGDWTGPVIASGKPFQVILPLVGRQITNPWISFIVEDFTGRPIVHNKIASRDIGVGTIDGECLLELQIPALWLSPGLYAAYFKFMIPSADNSSGKYLTEKFMLEVAGEPDKFGRGTVLNPPISWKIATE